MSRNFRVGDKVKVPYISENNVHNNQVGTIMSLEKYYIYFSEDWYDRVEKTRGTVQYEDGSVEHVNDFYNKENKTVRVPVKYQESNHD